MKNIFQVDETAVAGGLWHVQSGVGTYAPVRPRTAATATAVVANGGFGNGMRLLSVLGATTATSVIAAKAPAKRAPQSRGSSAHT